MIVLSGDRTLLLKVFARRVSPCDDGIAVSSVAQLPNAEVVAVFSDSPRRGELPHTIIVAKSQLREFFAWAATYLGHWSPLTARLRVLRRIDVPESLFNSGSDKRFSLDVARGLASLIVGETLCEWNLAGEKSSPTLLSLRSTFSYAAFFALKKRCADSNSVLEAWDRAQRLLKLNARRIDRRHFLSLWQPLYEAISDIVVAEESSQIAKHLSDMIRHKQLPYLPPAEGDSLFDRSDAGTSREDAVVRLEHWLSRRNNSRPIDKFYTACLATKLSPGALTHFDVLVKMTKMDTEVLLWYSFISGLLATEPSGQSIERMLFRLSGDCDEGATECCGDISIDELEVLAQSDGQLPLWVGAGGGSVCVELKPGVCSYFRLREKSVSPGAALPLHNGEISDVRVLDDLLDQLRSLFRKTVKSPSNVKKRRKK